MGAIVLGTAMPASAAISASPSLEHTYTADTTSMLVNPERGWFIYASPFQDLQEGMIGTAHGHDVSIVHASVDLSEFTDKPLSDGLLDKLKHSFSLLRQGGLKVILRFAYSLSVPGGDATACPDPANPPADIPPDAPLSLVESQLVQLTGLLHENTDVIYAFDAGFIGEWGEWHCSSNDLATDENKKVLIKEILDAFPAERQVGIRYPADLKLFRADPAIDTTRLGSHQDCYASSPYDSGTWSTEPGEMQAQMQMIHEIGGHAIVGGEACAAYPQRTNCTTALTEMPFMHFAYLAKEFKKEAVELYQAPVDCWDEIGRNLGYRVQLQSATFSDTLRAGEDIRFSATLHNAGWSSMTNERPVFLVLQKVGDDGVRHTIPLDADPREWKPGEDARLEQTVHLPNELEPGSYRLALWLPDAAENLRDDPRFSVQFASTGVWDARLGLNILGDVTVPDASRPETVRPELAATGAFNASGLFAGIAVLLATGALLIGLVSQRRTKSR